MSDLTTRQLAEKLALAALNAGDRRGGVRGRVYRAADAILETLHEQSSWFCHCTETPQGTQCRRYALLDVSEHKS